MACAHVFRGGRRFRSRQNRAQLALADGIQAPVVLRCCLNSFQILMLEIMFAGASKLAFLDHLAKAWLGYQ